MSSPAPSSDSSRVAKPTGERAWLHKVVSYRPDTLIVFILVAVILGLVVPVRGSAADVADTVVTVAVALLFFLYGARLSPRAALDGLMHWRLHLLIMAFTFLVFPLIGFALYLVLGSVNTTLAIGVLFCTLVPSTVQSSVTFTSVARGNVAAAVVAASASSLLGVLLTPALVFVLIGTEGSFAFDTSTLGKIALQLLVPFLLGQLLRRWVGVLASNKAVKKLDQLVIAGVVYVSFAAGTVSGTWAQMSWVVLVALTLGAIVLVKLMLTATSAASRRLGFIYADQVAIQFAGTKKSLAAGLPMATVLFGSMDLSLIILPLMVFHQVQLIMCSIRASAYGADESRRETY